MGMMSRNFAVSYSYSTRTLQNKKIKIEILVLFILEVLFS